MSGNDLVDRVNAVFQEVFDDPSISVRREMTAEDIEDWDSLNHTRLVVSLELAFGVRFQATEISELQNVGQFLDLLSTKVAG